MTDRKQAPGTPRIPIEPVERTGGETGTAPKSDTFDPAPPEDQSGMASQGGEGGGAAPPKDGERRGGMIGEG